MTSIILKVELKWDEKFFPTTYDRENFVCLLQEVYLDKAIYDLLSNNDKIEIPPNPSIQIAIEEIKDKLKVCCEDCRDYSKSCQGRDGGCEEFWK